MLSFPYRKPFPINVYLPRQLHGIIKAICLLGVAACFALFGGAPVKIFALGALRARKAEAGERVDRVESLWIFAELRTGEVFDFLGVG